MPALQVVCYMRVWSVTVCLTFLSVNHCLCIINLYILIYHYKKDFCRYIKDTYDYLSQCFYTLIILRYQMQRRRVREHCVFFAQSLPLSILLSRAQPNPSALCRQPTHHIQMAQWPTHTAGCLYGDCLPLYKRHFVVTGAASKFHRLVHVSS